MADGALTIELDDYTAAKIAERAQAMGLSPAELAKMVLDARFFDYDDFVWINGDPRHDDASADDLELGGRSWEEVRPEFEAMIDKAFGKPA
ncbi:MAG: hypothetical protein J0L52_08125 [Caulobacterales bacterium]|nr:hypothetical protein [Caulobacterales bacterium]